MFLFLKTREIDPALRFIAKKEKIVQKPNNIFVAMQYI